MGRRSTNTWLIVALVLAVAGGTLAAGRSRGGRPSTSVDSPQSVTVQNNQLVGPITTVAKAGYKGAAVNTNDINIDQSAINYVKATQIPVVGNRFSLGGRHLLSNTPSPAPSPDKYSGGVSAVSNQYVSISQSSGNFLDQSGSRNYGTYNSMKDASIKLNTGSAVADGSVAGYNTVSGNGRLNVKRTTSRFNYKQPAPAPM